MKAGRFEEQTYYDILEILPDAAQHEIHAAYQRAKDTYSADSPALYTMFTQQEARELLALIEEAFTTLSNQTRRALYDQQLSMSGASRMTQLKSVPKNKTQDLPDFHIPEENIQSEPPSAVPFKPMPQKHEPTKETPSGFARTKFGVYEVKNDMEEQIRNSDGFTGAFLQKIRLYKNISLEQVMDETRINRPYLVALENDDYAALPAPVFARGFVVQLSRLLNLEEKKVVDSYMVNYKKARSL